MIAGALEVPAPPVAIAAETLDPLDDDQPVWVDLQDGIARPLRGEAPIGARIAVAPGGLSVWLVVEVGSNDRRLRPIVTGQHCPIIEPAAFRYAIRIPELALRIGRRPMAVENDDETSATRTFDDAVHHLEAVETFEVGVLPEIDGGWQAGRLQHLVAERKPDRVEAGGDDLVEHVLPVSRP